MFHKINFCSILASLVLFCLPWVDIQCSGKSQATQSGLQVVYGGASLVDDNGQPRRQKQEIEEDRERKTLGFAPLTASALALLIMAGYCSWRGLARGKRTPDIPSAALPALALVLLLLQWQTGFPAETTVPELMAANQANPGQPEPAKTGFLQAILNPVSTMVAGNIEVKTLPAFFYLLATLAIPPLVLVFSLVLGKTRPRPKKRN